MNYDKFLKNLAKAYLVMMVFAIIFLFRGRQSKVKDYKLSEDITYSGEMDGNKFYGQGTLLTKDGLYKGNFKDGLIEGDGVYIGDDYYYIRKGKDTYIKYNDGRIFRKDKDKWEQVDEKRED